MFDLSKISWVLDEILLECKDLVCSLESNLASQIVSEIVTCVVAVNCLLLEFKLITLITPSNNLNAIILPSGSITAWTPIWDVEKFLSRMSPYALVVIFHRVLGDNLMHQILMQM